MEYRGGSHGRFLKSLLTEGEAEVKIGLSCEFEFMFLTKMYKMWICMDENLCIFAVPPHTGRVD